jgi:RNA polymerase sigma-70 factor (ECF subfamily)
MNEGQRLAAGPAILGEAAALVRRQDARKQDSLEREAQTQDAVLEGLVRQHARLVYRIASVALRSHHDAEDATQETFMRVLRYRSKLCDVEDAKTWLARIAWRVAVDRYKRLRHSQEISLEERDKPGMEIASSDVPADESIHGAQVGGTLEKLITALPEKLRQPLILSTVEEMSPREVAATLGINEAAVRSRVFRARQILRDRLAERLGRNQG